LKYAQSQFQSYPKDALVPVTGVLDGDWVDLAHRGDPAGSRILRTVHEVCLFRVLRERLRCTKIWVDGADRWRNPEEDLPADFEAHRGVCYAKLAKPLASAEFIEPLQAEMTAELEAIQQAPPDLPWLKISPRGGGQITLTPLDALLAERLILCIFGYGTNIGLRAISAGEHSHSEEDLRYVRRRYLSAEGARSFAAAIANTTFAARQEPHRHRHRRGHLRLDALRRVRQNLFTEHHVRYGGRGVLIYWHVDKKSVAIHSQLISCTASEVAATIEGAMHHRTDMDVPANYVDTRGQSEVGFGLTRLLGFELKPRLKRINVTKLYIPDAQIRAWIPDLLPVVSRHGPIRWELIEQQFDQLIKYATAISNRTASTEAILRRFTRAATHPTSGDAGGRPRPADDLSVPLPPLPRKTGGQRRFERRRILERRQRTDPLRQSRRHRLQLPRRTGNDRGVPAHRAGPHDLRETP